MLLWYTLCSTHLHCLRLANLVDERKSKSISEVATADEVMQWLNSSRFKELAKPLKGLTGVDLLRFSKEDLIAAAPEHRGMAIALFNALHQGNFMCLLLFVPCSILPNATPQGALSSPTVHLLTHYIQFKHNGSKQPL